MSRISAIILNYNSSQDTITLYDQIKSFSNELSVIIIDNNSVIHEIKKLEEAIPYNEIIFNKKNLGYAGGNNIGIKKAIKEGAEYIWILNPDVRIEKETLPLLLQEFQKNEKLAAVGSRICFRNKKDQIFSDGGIVDKETYLARHINYNKLITDKGLEVNCNISYINGDSILLNVNAIKDIGTFYEGFFLYFEETEWCNRALKNNWELKVNTKSVVYHGTSNKRALYHYYMTRNRLIFAKIDNLNYKKVQYTVGIQLIYEFYVSIKKFKFPIRFYLNRVRGYVSGVFHHLKNYNENITIT